MMTVREMQDKLFMVRLHVEGVPKATQVLDEVINGLDHVAPVVFVWESVVDARVGELVFRKGTGLFYSTHDAAARGTGNEPVRTLAVLVNGNYHLVGRSLPTLETK